MTDTDGDHGLLDELAQAYIGGLRAGQPVTIEAYAVAHPRLAQRIRELFPVVAAVEGLAESKSPQAETAVDAGEVPSPSAGAPKFVGEYRISREIGHGGMGRVFEAVGADGATVAIKIVHPHLVDRSGYLARFLREVEVGLRIRHLGLIETLGSGTADVAGAEVPYLVLEYVEGQNLRELLAEFGRVSERLCRLIGARLAEALVAVHAAGVVHRDIKPENVILTTDQSVKLMDLGVAFLQEEANRLSQTGEFVGSLLYAAPEQMLGETPDGRADLYSLGLLLYELATGRHPEARGEDLHPCGRDLGRVVPAASSLVGDLSPFLDAVLAQLLSREPDARFATAAEVVEVLSRGERSSWWQRQDRGTGTRGTSRPAVQHKTALYGRVAELRKLDASLVDVRAGRGQVIAVRGEAGIGKSRLTQGWLERAERDTGAPIHTAVVRHDPGETPVGIPPLAEALGGLLGAEQLESRLERLLGQSACLAEPLASHLRGEESGGVGSSLPVATLSTAYLLLLRGLAKERPLVLVFEDLHFAGPEARSLFLGVARAIQSDAILLIGTTRPFETDPTPEAFERLPHASEIALTGLDADACYDVLNEALGGRGLVTSGAAQLVRSSDGNPFCLIEFAEEARRRSRETGRDPLAPGIEIPTSVRHLLEARLGSLDEDARDLLAIAACCGHVFDPVLVCAAAEVGRVQGLRTFLALDRIHRLVQSDGVSYRFRHHLVQESLYADLHPSLRAAYHTALAEALERRVVGGDPRGDQVEAATAGALARHFLLGDVPERALPYVARGAVHAQRLGQFGRADRMAQRGLALGQPLPPADEARLHSIVGHASFVRAGSSPAIAHFRRGLELASQAQAPALMVEAGVELAQNLRLDGQTLEGLTVARKALQTAEAAGEPALCAKAATGLLTTLSQVGRHDEARELGERSLAWAREAQDVSLECDAAHSLGSLALDQGDLDGAQPLLEHAWLTAQMCGNWLTENNALSVLSKVAYIRGDVALARDLNRKHAMRGREMGFAQVEVTAGVNASTMSLDVGQFEAALSEATTAQEISLRLGYARGTANAEMMIGRVQEARGDLAAAHDWLVRALERAREAHNALLAGGIHGRLTQLCAWGGAFEEARSHGERGSALLKTMPNAPATGLLHLGAADLHWAEGNPDQGYAHLDAQLADFTSRKIGGALARIHLQMGMLALAAGRPAVAETNLHAAVGHARGAGLLGWTHAARIALGAVSDEALTAARVILQDGLEMVPLTIRVLVVHQFAAARDADDWAATARDGLRTLVARAPAAWRAPMKTAVVPFGPILV